MPYKLIVVSTGYAETGYTHCLESDCPSVTANKSKEPQRLPIPLWNALTKPREVWVPNLPVFAAVFSREPLPGPGFLSYRKVAVIDPTKEEPTQ